MSPRSDVCFRPQQPLKNAPTQEFREWAAEHVHAIASVEDDTHGDADLRALNKITVDARVVASGEPFHRGHEPLAMRTG